MSNIVSHTICVIVKNEPGVLSRVAGLFSGRGYNVDSLTVSSIDKENNISRITIVTSATAMVIEQIKAQLNRIVPVLRVVDLTLFGPSVERELALIKIVSKGEERVEALRLADVYRASVVDSTLESFVFEIVGGTSKIDSFVELMEQLGEVQIARTGITAISRGSLKH